MYSPISSETFLNSSKSVTSVLFIKEVGCRYCEVAERSMAAAHIEQRFKTIKFFEVKIDDEPDLPAKLGLIGVPAFLKIKPNGQKRILVGFESVDVFERFLNGD